MTDVLRSIRNVLASKYILNDNLLINYSLNHRFSTGNFYLYHESWLSLNLLDESDPASIHIREVPRITPAQ